MKVSQKQLTELLSSLGLDVELVEDDNAEFNPETVTGELQSYFQPEIEKALTEKLESAAGAKSNGAALSAIQFHFGIPKKELDGKTFKEMFAIVKEKQQNSGEASEYKQKYEDAVRDYEAQIEKLDADWKLKHETEVSAEKAKYINRDIEASYQTLVEKMPRKGGDLTKQSRAIRNLLKEDGITEEYDEASKSLKLFKDGKPLKVEDTIKSYAADILPLATSTAHVNPAEVRAGKNTMDAGIEQVRDDKFAAIANWANEG